MQRVLRLNILARNQALKRQRRKSEEIFRDEQRKVRQQKVEAARSKRSAVKAERAHRREDWMLGPLAPNRLAGKDAGGYGMVDFQATRSPLVLKAEREKYFNFAVNDRVVVMSGREKGKIGKVREVDEEQQTVALIDVNMVDVKIPPFMREQDNSKAPFRAFSVPLLIKDVRLVVPLRNNATGEIKDTVVKHLRGGPPFPEAAYLSKTPKHTRYIAGLDIPVPWPKDEVPERKTEAADTLRVDVDDISFSATLNHIHMPVSVIDELRNKHSRTRKSHTQEYVQQKMKEDAEEHWKKRRRMLLPQQEYWEHKAKQKETQSKTGLTKETLDLIREVQAANLGDSSGSTIGPAS